MGGVEKLDGGGGKGGRGRRKWSADGWRRCKEWKGVEEVEGKCQHGRVGRRGQGRSGLGGQGGGGGRDKKVRKRRNVISLVKKADKWGKLE